MNTETPTSKARLWTSYILQGILIVMFSMGAIMNLLMTETAVTGAVQMGYTEGNVRSLGVILLITIVLFALPKTNVLGAILLTGWLGGAVATHVIHSDPLSLTLAPVVFGCLVWLSIGLRRRNLSALLPFVK